MFDRFRLHPLLADLPDVIHLPARVGHHPRLRAAVDLLGAELAESRAGAGAGAGADRELVRAEGAVGKTERDPEPTT